METVSSHIDFSFIIYGILGLLLFFIYNLAICSVPIGIDSGNLYLIFELVAWLYLL